jgi:hypothetical protein
MENTNNKNNSKKKLFKKLFTNNKINIFSFSASSYLSYRYLKNKFLFSEHHGHFNSPRNILNKNLISFHLMEACVRLVFGFCAIKLGLHLVRNSYFTQETEDNIENINNNKNIEIPSNKENISKNNSEFSFENVTLPNLADLEDKFSIDDTLRRKKLVENYLNSNKK